MDRPVSRVVVIGATGHIGTYLVPRYTALGALREALAWLADNGQADIGGRPFAGILDLTVAGTTVKPNICGRPQGR